MGIPTVNPTYQNLINDQQQQQQPEVPEITSQQKRVGGGLSGIEEAEENKYKEYQLKDKLKLLMVQQLKVILIQHQIQVYKRNMIQWNIVPVD